MQPMDEQSFDKQTTNGPLYQESQEEQARRNREEPQLEQWVDQAQPRSQINDYHAASEQVPPVPPPAPAFYPSTPASYPPEAATQPQPVIHPLATPGAGWAYPPNHEHYQGTASGQPFGTAGSEQAGQPGGPVAFGPSSQMVAPASPKRSKLRTGTLLALLALLAIVFGTGLFAGWQFGRTSVTPTGSSGFQPGSNSSVAIPQL
ncbi:MAG: hypothetical protein ACRDHW_16995, partial [Ktedonobacteraceae bacterium]